MQELSRILYKEKPVPIFFHKGKGCPGSGFISAVLLQHRLLPGSSHLGPQIRAAFVRQMEPLLIKPPGGFIVLVGSRPLQIVHRTEDLHIFCVLFAADPTLKLVFQLSYLVAHAKAKVQTAFEHIVIQPVGLFK